MSKKQKRKQQSTFALVPKQRSTTQHKLAVGSTDVRAASDSFL